MNIKAILYSTFEAINFKFSLYIFNLLLAWHFLISLFCTCTFLKSKVYAKQCKTMCFNFSSQQLSVNDTFCQRCYRMPSRDQIPAVLRRPAELKKLILGQFRNLVLSLLWCKEVRGSLSGNWVITTCTSPVVQQNYLSHHGVGNFQ